MFHSFFSSLARFRYFSSFSLSFSFTLWSVRTAKSTRKQSLFFFLIKTWSGLLPGIEWSVCYLESHLICSLFYDRFWFVHKAFVSIVKFQSLAQFPEDQFSHTVLHVLVFLLSSSLELSTVFYRDLSHTEWSLFFPEYPITPVSFLDSSRLSGERFISCDVSNPYIKPTLCHIWFTWRVWIITRTNTLALTCMYVTKYVHLGTNKLRGWLVG